MSKSDLEIAQECVLEPIEKSQLKSVFHPIVWSIMVNIRLNYPLISLKI